MLSGQDEQEITRLILRYAAGIDRRNYSLFRSCFADDAVCDYADTMRWTSGDAITQFMEELHRPMGETLHRMSNVMIEETPAGAHARTYVDALLTTPDGKRIMEVDGYYDDVMIKTDDGWKIKERKFTLVQLEGQIPDIPR